MSFDFYDEEHEEFRTAVRDFIEHEIAPHYAEWDAAHMMPRDAWTAAAENGLVGLAIGEEHGGMGLSDYRFRAVLDEEFVRTGTMAFGLALHLQDDWVLPHILAFASPEQQQRWLPRMLAAELVTSVAFTEPGAGSDLRGVRTRAVRDGEHYVLDGQKTFIGNGISGDAALVLARTDGSTGRGCRDSFSLLLVEKGEGYTTGKQLDKMGLKASDTAELFFDGVRVPAENLVGAEGAGLDQVEAMLPQGRLGIAVASTAVARGVIDETLRYVGDRQVFGTRVADLQNTRFQLARMHAETSAAEALVARAVAAFNEGYSAGRGGLDGSEAATAKLFASRTARHVTDGCLQLHGGYGYILEYPVAQAFLAARLFSLFGGTDEIMQETIARRLLPGSGGSGH